MTAEKGREKAEEVLGVIEDCAADILREYGEQAEQAFRERMLEGAMDWPLPTTDLSGVVVAVDSVGAPIVYNTPTGLVAYDAVTGDVLRGTPNDDGSMVTFSMEDGCEYVVSTQPRETQ